MTVLNCGEKNILSADETGRKFRTLEGKSQVKPGMGIILLCASEEHLYRSGEAGEWTENPGHA